MYVPLRVHSHFSMLTGVDSPGALVERARDLRIPALALTDVDGTAGLVEFLRAAEDSSTPGTPGTPETSARPVERIPGEEPPEERGLHSGSGSGFNPGPSSGPSSGPRPIVGAELTDGGGRAGRLVALVEDEEGHRNLCRLISMRHGSRVEGVPVEELTEERTGEPSDPDDFDLITAVSEHHTGLILLADHPRLLLGLYGRVPSERLLAAISPASLRMGGITSRTPERPRGAERNTHLSPRTRRDVTDELHETVDGDLVRPKCPPPARPTPALSLVEAAQAIGVATIAVPDVYHALPGGRDDHRLRVAIKHNALVEDLPETWLAPAPSHLPTFAEMCALYADLPDVPGPWRERESTEQTSARRSPLRGADGTPMSGLPGAGSPGVGAPGAVLRTVAVAERCRYTPPLGGVVFPEIELEDEETPYSRLCTLAFEGARRRYQPLRPEVLRRLDYELSTIHQLGFAPYFLLVHEIASFAETSGIPCVGRGSAADSLVAYSLGLTDADPFRYRLPFERFLNPERRDRPDIDLDFCWRRRDEVLEHVFELFGAERTAMICTLNRFGLRSAFRESALALGVPPAEVNPWSKRLPMFPMGAPSFDGIQDPDEGSEPSLVDLPPHLHHNPLALSLWALPEARDFPFEDGRLARALELGARLIETPRHFGLHPGGVVVSPDPISDRVPCQRAAKQHPTRGHVIVTQLDKDGVEAIGLVKMDLLGNRALTTIADTLDTLLDGGIEVDLDSLDEEDSATAELLASGRTVGCFQVESPGMRNLLQQIGARTMDDVIQAVALIRPGPAGSGMKDAYIRRFRGLEDPAPPHPRLVDVLWDTYGVMLYQEDVMQAAARVAGMEMAEADQLRRALQKRRTHEFGEHHTRFLSGAAREGIEAHDAERVWDLVANFASFAFCKAHAVTYGRIAYRTAWLKAHHPAAFLVAFLASETGYYPARVYVEEARRLRVPILGPDVNRSTDTFSVERLPPSTEALRVGLFQIKGISERLVEAILDTREAEGPFLSLPDFLERTGAHTDEASALIQCGAFDAFDRTRPELLWRLHLLRTPQVRAPRGAGLDSRALDACRTSPTSRAAEAVDRARARTGGWSGRGIGVGAAELRPGETAALFPEPPGDAVALPGLPDPDHETRGRVEFELLGLCIDQHPVRLFPCPADERLAESFGRGAGAVHARFHSSAPGSPCGHEPSGIVREGPDEAVREAPAGADVRPVNPTPCGELARHASGRITLRGWPAATRRVRTEGGELMRFLTLEDESGLAEVILFPDVYRRDGHRLAEHGVVCVTGVVEDQMGACNLRAERIW